jgi:DNA-binding MarR family transcriptional regulator
VASGPRLDLGNYLPYLVNRVGAALVENFTQNVLIQHDLSIASWRVLAALSTNGEQRQVDLAQMTSIETSTLSRLVTRLVRMRLVTRRRSPESDREVVVGLTAKGRALVNRLIPLAAALERAAVAGIPAKDLVVVKRALRAAYQNLTGKNPAPQRTHIATSRRAVQRMGL